MTRAPPRGRMIQRAMARNTKRSTDRKADRLKPGDVVVLDEFDVLLVRLIVGVSDNRLAVMDLQDAFVFKGPRAVWELGNRQGWRLLESEPKTRKRR